MPIFQRQVDFNVMFNQSSEPPIIINDLTNNSEEDKEYIKELVTTRYSSDMITLLPSCRCGVTKGEFSVGVKCTYCNTTVKSSIENEIEPSVWFRKPIGVTALINPIIWIMLKARFKKSGYSIIQWITDTSYRANVQRPPVINKIMEAGVQRGYNYFIENFDEIMNVLFSLKDFRKEGTDYLQLMLKEYRQHLFSDYIPIPNKSLLIIEKTNVGVYVDPIIVEAVDAIEALVSIDKNFHDQNPRVKENRTAKALSGLCEYYEKYYKTGLSPKSGQLRRHIYGTRTNFSFRAVIVSLTDTHQYDEIYAPWGVGVSAFRPHLLNKLMKMGMDINSAVGLLLGHVSKYHPTIDKLLQEIIDESPKKKIPVILGRNPSLLQGSVLAMGISKFKTDPTDQCISLPITVVKSLNADFDGKQHCRH